MMQFLKKDDPLVTQRFYQTPEELAAGAKQSGVNRVLLLGPQPLAAESSATVNFVLDCINLSGVFELLSNAQVCCCVDLKMILLLLVQKAAGARYACPYCLFS